MFPVFLMMIYVYTDDEFYPAKSGHPDGIRALNRKQAAAATQQAACAHKKNLNLVTIPVGQSIEIATSEKKVSYLLAPRV